MPPRHAKTETVSVRVGSYWLMDAPADNVLLTGYNERFARRLGRKARNIASDLLRLDPAKQAADEWCTVEGGTHMTRGVGSPPTGTGFKLIVIDDPIRRREDAESENERERAWDWYTDDLYTRLEPGGAIIMVATCWHDDDIIARAVASEPGRWTVLKLPAIAVEDDELGRRAGDALWPERYDLPALNRIMAVMQQNDGLRGWEALYQQNPTPKTGTFFKIDKLEIVYALPTKIISTVRWWDVASSKGKGSACTAGVKMCVDSLGYYYVIDVVCGQWESAERDRIIKQTADLDGRAVKIGVPIDPGSAGIDVSNVWIKLLAGYSVEALRVTGDKETEADPFASQVNAGNVKLLVGEWNKPFIAELGGFPHHKRKDQVDAGSGAFKKLSFGRRSLTAGSIISGQLA